MPLCLLLSSLSVCSFAYSAPTHRGWGKVSMYGEILDTACAIETGSQDQTIDMGVLPTAVIRQFGKAPPKVFSIHLTDCRFEHYSYSSDQPEWQYFDVTFDGPANGEFFTVAGEAKGIQLAMRDEYGTTVIAGKPLPKREIAEGNTVLNYELQLVANHQVLQAGAYQTLLRFKIDYY